MNVTTPVQRRRLGLRLAPLAEPSWIGLEIGVEISIDGRRLLDHVRDVEAKFGGTLAGGYASVTPLEIFGLVEWVEREPWTFAGVEALLCAQGATLLVCSCGDVGCWSLSARVEVDGDSVRWSRLESSLSCRQGAGRHYRHLDPMTFARKAYARELARLAPGIGSMLKKRRETLANARHARRVRRMFDKYRRDSI